MAFIPYSNIDFDFFYQPAWERLRLVSWEDDRKQKERGRRKRESSIYSSIVCVCVRRREKEKERAGKKDTKKERYEERKIPYAYTYV